MAVPAKLYKYRSFSTQEILSLRARQIWFSKPVDFNDPYECNTGILLEDPSGEELLEIYKEYRDDLLSGVSPGKRRKLRSEFSGLITDGFPNQKYIDIVKPRVEEELQKLKRRIRDHGGVCCFSEKWDDPLMWSHYSDGHRGFCLEFDSSFEPFHKAVKVTYKNHFPKVPWIRCLKQTSDSPIEDVMTVVAWKHSSWTYEAEWRSFHEKGRQYFNYGVEALTGIYFGSEMPQTQRDLICHILADSPTVLYKMHRSDVDYSMSKTELTYEPYDFTKHTHGRSVKGNQKKT